MNIGQEVTMAQLLLDSPRPLEGLGREADQGPGGGVSARLTPRLLAPRATYPRHRHDRASTRPSAPAVVRRRPDAPRNNSTRPRARHSSVPASSAPGTADRTSDHDAPPLT